ncbi:S41 family peptidase [Eubacteriales bacterium OttesenSCG-928-N13]|nr:S41 family peptidase [Eubacteriales bacterium OttesenSCG-928-N13]
MKKQSIIVLAIVWMLVVVAAASSAITLSLMGVFSAENAPLVDALIRVSDNEFDTIKRYSRLEEVRQILSGQFYHELDDDALMQGAIDGMMRAADDVYTFYYTPEDRLKSIEQTQGEYEGVGLVMSMNKDGQLIVLRVYANTPAEKAGIRPGDQITMVNGVDIKELGESQMNTVSTMIAEGDRLVKMEVERDGKTIPISVEKSVIHVERALSRMLDDQIGYIAIYEFQGSDVEDFNRSLKELKDQGMKALVIDVRDNPGGLLEDVVTISDTLLPKGLLVYIEDRAGRRESYYSNESALDIPIAVLVNGSSASASEILAGAVQDFDAGIVVGTTTYGKGIVQTLIPFPDDGAAMQLTTAVYYTPKGRAIHGIGIEPDVVVETPKDLTRLDMELHPELDTQLTRAAELLRKEIQ